MRLPPSAKQIATDPTASAHRRMTSGAYGPLLAASAAGTTKIEAPTTIPMMLAARPHGPTARTSPASRWLDCIRLGADSALTSEADGLLAAVLRTTSPVCAATRLRRPDLPVTVEAACHARAVCKHRGVSGSQNRWAQTRRRRALP